MSIECAFFGALGQDAERKTSKSGRGYLRINVGVGVGDVAQWVSVLAFDPQAVDVVDKLVAGARVYVEGRLSTEASNDASAIHRHRAMSRKHIAKVKTNGIHEPIVRS